ncbi:hypothetical protein TSUD_410730 [Trifolium subterraneum]|uniref:Uncharacterized protein n=1 Tax=Trifolium subterraneum TaxID=3900 RepID=A0A2Z6P2Y3_TRISU|nr:hypothetical protein TSUD_410730 [Trifolium subterraneum]
MSSLGFITGIIITVILTGTTAGRDLRPSDHGLSFQSPPPANSPTEMRSFFNSNNNSSNSSSSFDNSPWGVTDSIPPAIQRTTGRNGGGRLGKALVWASLVCGITGGVLLVVSILIYLFNRKRRRNLEQNDSFRFDDDNNVTNKQELVQN